MEVRTRFAPSPTGFMHIGNLRTALYAYLYAKQNGGKFILRIEDTDRERLVDGAVEAVYSTLKKAKIFHDEGPDKGGACAPYVQSERKHIYKEYAEKLVSLGGAYYCFCGKERLETLADENGIKRYDKHCLKLSPEEIKRKLDAGEPYVIRQNMPLTGESKYTDLVFGEISVPCDELEDNILLKSDGMPTYNFANVADDHLMGITHVIRGIEYLSSTPKYNLIYRSFGWKEPEYIHLPLIMKDAQRKLSKRHGDANFEDFIAKGYLPEAIVNYIALLGWSPGINEEKLSMERLTELFSLSGISKSGSIFDEGKMRWLNAQYIREKTPEEFALLAAEWLDKSKVKGKYDYKKLSKLVQQRIEILSEIPEKVNFIEEFGAYDLNLYTHVKMKTDAVLAEKAVAAAISVFETAPLDEETLLAALAEKAAEEGIKKGQLLFCLRLAVTGKETTAGGATELAGILGREEILSRLRFSLDLIRGAAV